jgi:hypothetical protein
VGIPITGYKSLSSRHSISWLMLLTIVSILVFPRSYAIFKMGLILATTAVFLLTKHRHIISKSPVPIFLAFGIAVFGITWSLVGLTNGSDVRAIHDSLRLYVFWSFCWAFLSYCISLGGGLRLLHQSFLISAFLICFISILGVVDTWFAMGIVSFDIRNELKLFVGIHDGYIQLTSHNVGSLFFLVNYFFIIIVSKNRSEKHTINLLVYFLLILVAIISGRRALWVTIAIAHFLGIFLSLIFPKFFNRKSINRFVIVSAGFFTISLTYLVKFTDYSLMKTIEHIASAFSSGDERSLQAPYLIEGFINNLWFGSGFGGEVDYQRSDTAAWLYEMVYHQLAFNVGLIGLMIACLFAGFILVRSLDALRQSIDCHYILAIHFGCLAFAIACYSNPYLGSFDFMIYIWLLIFIGLKTKISYKKVLDGVNG